MVPVRLVLPAACLALVLAAPALAGDIIVNAGGKPQGNTKASVPPAAGDYAGSDWEILEENIDGITYRIGDLPQAQSLPRSNVKAVYHDPSLTPQELTRGEALLDRGDFDAARAALARVDKDPQAQTWAKAQAAFLAAKSYADESKPADAEKAYAQFKQAFPKSWWVVSATEGRARALLSMDKIEDAKTEFASLRKLPGVSEDVAVEADFWLVWIDEQVAVAKNDQAALEAARKAYEALITKLQGKPALEALFRRAKAGRASVLIAQGKHADAKTDLEKDIKDAKDPRALASLYNKLGLATWRAAPTDKKELRAALEHFLRVVTLYGTAEGADEDCAEAMYHAGALFKELRDQGPDWGLRARREWNECTSRFPGSPWARKAKLALAER